MPRILTAILAAALLVAALPGVASARTRTVTCKGTETACSARVSIAGGASNLRLVIELPGTSYRNPSVVPSSRTLRGAYSLSGGRFTTGGSVYRVTLNAVRSIPRGSYLTFRFRAR